MTDISTPLPAKRRRGRPRKDTNLHQDGGGSPGKKPAPTQPTLPMPIHLTPDASHCSTTHEPNPNPNPNPMVGSWIYGVVEGSFDAGYLISVRIGDCVTPFRGVVFEPRRLVPVTTDNGLAPLVHMHQRWEIAAPFPKPMVFPSILPSMPLRASPYSGNQSAFLSFPHLRGKAVVPSGGPPNKPPPPVHPIDESMLAFHFAAGTSGPTEYTPQFVHDLLADQSRPISKEPLNQRPEYGPNSPNLELDLSPSAHTLFLPPALDDENVDFVVQMNRTKTNNVDRQETSNEAESSPSGPYGPEIATRPNSFVGCMADVDFALDDAVEPTEHRPGKFAEDKQ